MSDIDFQAMLDGMSVGVGGSDPIRSIYSIIPTYDNIQQHLLFQAFYFIEKYDLVDMREMFTNFEDVMQHNKNMSFWGTQNLKNMLAAYTKNEYLRGLFVFHLYAL